MRSFGTLSGEETVSGSCEGGGMRMMVMMKCWLWGLVCGTPFMLGDVLATYRLNAQSFAQSRNNGRPPTRTLNPESKFNSPF